MPPPVSRVPASHPACAWLRGRCGRLLPQAGSDQQRHCWPAQVPQAAARQRGSFGDRQFLQPHAGLAGGGEIEELHRVGPQSPVRHSCSACNVRRDDVGGASPTQPVGRLLPRGPGHDEQARAERAGEDGPMPINAGRSSLCKSLPGLSTVRTIAMQFGVSLERDNGPLSLQPGHSFRASSTPSCALTVVAADGIRW